MSFSNRSVSRIGLPGSKGIHSLGTTNSPAQAQARLRRLASACGTRGCRASPGSPKAFSRTRENGYTATYYSRGNTFTHKGDLDSAIPHCQCRHIFGNDLERHRCITQALVAPMFLTKFLIHRVCLLQAAWQFVDGRSCNYVQRFDQSPSPCIIDPLTREKDGTVGRRCVSSFSCFWVELPSSS